MDKEIIGILLAFILYCLYVLVPLIPATLIYKWFPDTKVSAHGRLSKLKINSSGAFAAYIVTVLLGSFLISSTQDKILDLKTPITPTWTIKGEIELRDQNDNPVNHPTLLNKIDLSIKPDFLTYADGNMHLKLPGTESGEWPQFLVTLNVLGFGSETINLTKLEKYHVKLDRSRKVIDFTSPIIVKTINDPNQPYSSTQPYLNN